MLFQIDVIISSKCNAILNYMLKLIFTVPLVKQTWEKDAASLEYYSDIAEPYIYPQSTWESLTQRERFVSWYLFWDDNREGSTVTVYLS